jgi:hypothetical protein
LDSIYAEESLSVGHDVADWAFKNGDNPKLRIALCGYEGEYAVPQGWSVHCWSTSGGHAKASSKAMENRHKERIWFSPHCLKTEAMF